MRAYKASAEGIEVVPLGIHTDRYRAPSTDIDRWRSDKGLPPETPIVLYVARLVPPKHVDQFIDVARLVREHVGDVVLFVAVGDGSELPRLRERVRNEGLEGTVHLLGSLHGDDLVEAYHSCDIFLSTSRYESFGLAIIEAMAAGRPVVATAVGGVVELVEEGRTGLLVPAEDTKGLATATLELMNDPLRRHTMGAAGRQRAVRLYDVAHMVRGYQRLYEQLLERPDNSLDDINAFVLKSPDFSDWQRHTDLPGSLPYRIDHLMVSGLSLRWSDASHRFPWSWRPVRPALQALTKVGPPFLPTVLAFGRIARCPITVAMFESEANFLAWLRRIGIPPLRRRKLVVVACWLAELLTSFSERRLAWYRRTYAEVDRLVFFSSNQQRIFQELLDLPNNRLRFIPFGVDDDLFVPSTDDRGYVLAVGRDRGRDWPTLFAAMATAGLPTKVLCRPREVQGLDAPPNVEVLGFVDLRSYRQLLSGARVNVVASRDVAYPSGQSVVLESMATAKCSIVTDTPSMRDYLLPGVNVLTVAVGDPEGLANMVSEAYHDPGLRQQIGLGGRQSVEERFNARRMWADIAMEIRDLLS